MEPLEGELKRAFGRRTPPADFTAQVMGRVRGESRFQPSHPIQLTTKPRTSRRWAWVLTGALAASLTVGVFIQRNRASEARAAVQAETELLFALALAGEKVNMARDAVLNPPERGLQ